MTAEGWEPGDLNPQDQWPADFESAASTNSARLPRISILSEPLQAWDSGIPALKLGAATCEFGFDGVVPPVEVIQS